MSRPDHPHLHTLAFGEGTSPDAGQQAWLGMKTWTSDVATRGRHHPSCELGEGLGGGSPQPEHLPPGRSEAETPKLCHALPPGPCPISEHTRN